MRIMSFIKNYPVTAFFLAFLFISISVIFIESKVYASSSSKANDCDCIERTCPQELPPQTKNCSLKGYDCYCPLGIDASWTYCPTPVVRVCAHEGCSCSGDCTPADCNNECDILGCQGCFTQGVDDDYQCTRPPITCGDCNIVRIPG